MKIKASAGDLAYLMEEFEEIFEKLFPECVQSTVKSTNEECEEVEPENIGKEVRQILFDKLKEMSEIKSNSCIDGSDYARICCAMNEIAKTLLDK